MNSAHRYITSVTYDIVGNKWMQETVRLPISLHRFGDVITSDDRYIIILGGYTGNRNLRKNCESLNIFIFDLMNNTFAKSAILCPFADVWDSV